MKIFKDIRNTLHEIGLTFSFLTRIPVKVHGKPGEPAFFVLVGYAVGLMYVVLFRLTQFIQMSRPLSVIFVMAIVYYFFELLHFDGLIDTFDGFLCHRGRKERLEIMERGNIGPFALFYGILFVLIHFFLLTRMSSNLWLIFAAGPVSRWAMVLLLSIAKPAKNEGLAVSFYPFRTSSLLIASVLVLPVIIIAPISVLTALAGVTAITFLVNYGAGNLLSGITGDVLGANCLLAEVSSLLFMTL